MPLRTRIIGPFATRELAEAMLQHTLDSISEMDEFASFDFVEMTTVADPFNRGEYLWSFCICYGVVDVG